MDILLKVDDAKAKGLLEFLNTIPYIKTQQLTAENTLFINEINEAVNNLNLVKEGKLKSKPLQDLLNEI